ncbi:hypothetical protein [Marinobacter sp. SS21]|uniref:hypothetical protein n=1 Tax=Marinobacter sp. SS21 TaxID=2979460 RepID=UPI0023311574|nr:hypothetical protein [Marinobacter sp. SS21]MDC0661288.1 hypothetical protein [Marinobacter sp. SS21]
MRNLRTLPWGVLMMATLVPMSASAMACPMQPQTAYEQVYCQVWEKGGGNRLPSFDDFRRNTPQVQALLLKRHAARYGMDMPDSSPEPTRVRPQQVPVNDPLPSPAAESEQEPDLSQSPAFAFRDCRLEGEIIACPRQRYRLAANQSNSALAEGVLDDTNRLGLEAYQGDPNNETELRRYLSQAYDLYIRKMLDIGLGGATMSFTQFYHGYQRHQASGVDYPQRLEATFQLLKRDKQSMAVQARLTDALPQTLDDCEGVGLDIIVCDDVGTNWVFVGE